MQLQPQSIGPRVLPGPSLTVAAIYLAVSACATAPELDVMIHETPKGAVYLERIPDRSFQAAHPIRLDQAVVARVLRGVIVRDEKTVLDSTFSKDFKTVRAFSEEDVTFLAPFIATALAQAAADQQVGFRLFNYPSSLSFSQRDGAGVGSSEPLLTNSTLLETTSGVILIHNRSLHLTLTQFRHRPERVDTINIANRRLPDPSGQANREIVFVPQSALQPDSSRQSSWFGQSQETTLIIDYELLAKLPEPQTPASAAAPPTPATRPDARQAPSAQGAATRDEDLQTIKEQIIKKDTEMEALKKELQDIKRELGGLDAEHEPLKRKATPKTQESGR